MKKYSIKAFILLVCLCVLISCGGGGGGGNNDDSDTITYKIIIGEITNGTVISDITTTASDTRVTLTVAPNIGYELDTITLTDANGFQIPTIVVTEGIKYIFLMPSSNVTVNAIFGRPYSSAPGNRTGVAIGDIVLADGKTVTPTNYTNYYEDYTTKNGEAVGVIAYEGTSTAGGTTQTGGGEGKYYMVGLTQFDSKIWCSGSAAGYTDQAAIKASSSCSGYYNTYTYIVNIGDYNSTNYPAFYCAASYSVSGFTSGWFLPSRAELSLIGFNDNKGTINTGITSIITAGGIAAILNDVAYMTSSQSDDGGFTEYAERSTMDLGGLGGYGQAKDYADAVRVFRALD